MPPNATQLMPINVNKCPPMPTNAHECPPIPRSQCPQCREANAYE